MTLERRGTINTEVQVQTIVRFLFQQKGCIEQGKFLIKFSCYEKHKHSNQTNCCSMLQLVFEFFIFPQVVASQPKLKLKKASDQNGEAKLLILISAIIKQNYCLQTPEISRYCPQAPISRNPIWRSKSHLSWELKGWGWQELWEKQEDFRRGEVNPNQTKPNNTKPISSQFQEHWKWGWCQRQCKTADFLWNF